MLANRGRWANGLGVLATMIGVIIYPTCVEPIWIFSVDYRSLTPILLPVWLVAHAALGWRIGAAIDRSVEAEREEAEREE